MPTKMPVTMLVAAMLVAAPAAAAASSRSLDVEGELPLSAQASEGDLQLSWGFDADRIVMEVRVRTLGWVAVGFSPTGSMAGSDVALGWVDGTGAAHFMDGHVIDREVLRDASQDYSAVWLRENGTHTHMRLQRPLRTCDAHDMELNEDTIRVVWAYGAKDPASEADIPYHGPTTRGSMSVQLLGHGPPSEQPLPSQHAHFDVNYDKFEIPAQSTFYQCEIFPVPKLDRKHHLIKVVPRLQANNEAFVHHILVYTCSANANASHVGASHECNHPNMPDSFTHCFGGIMAGWAVGGGTFDYPPEAGFSLGTQGDPQFVMLETHYDNPAKLAGVTDSSGLRFYITSELRAYDSGMLEVGVNPQPTHFIPPVTPSFVSYAVCPTLGFSTVGPHGDALRGSLPRPAGVEPGRSARQSGEIQVFATILHAHLIGAAMQVRHFRQGKQIGHLGRDMGYDFNYQEARYLKELTSVLPGDELVTECTYRSTSRSHTTTGGLSTQDEMCIAFIYYYPRVNVSRCLSLYDMAAVAPSLGFTVTPEFPYMVLSPPEAQGVPVFLLYDRVNWTESTVRGAEAAARDMEHLAIHVGEHSSSAFPAQHVPKIPKDPEAPPCVPREPPPNAGARPSLVPALLAVPLALVAFTYCEIDFFPRHILVFFATPRGGNSRCGSGVNKATD
ncbi:DBH-like monooxygenase protein 1 isoform X1 [Lethenteron reissneri]|uniref:DBH-like monooxygenase protein 1 isoform X1 n=1 Tax=Lethenteron reissneri TaxID=7753 RepID=UPI002AB682C6|nr:DBH-like monooxygenase protein 1 isoform X1 [Lethenteron reissneri]